jgi:hypothetical protein
MLDAETLRGMYAERGVQTDWQELTPDALSHAFKLWYWALPSPGAAELEGLDPDDEEDAELIKAANYAELLIHQPVQALRLSRIIPEDGDEPNISTIVVNHQKTLNRFIMHAFAVASNNPRTVGITIVKEEAPGD